MIKLYLIYFCGNNGFTHGNSADIYNLLLLGNAINIVGAKSANFLQGCTVFLQKLFLNDNALSHSVLKGSFTIFLFSVRTHILNSNGVCIVGKKWDHRILDPLIFSGKIRKNTKS